MGNKRSDKTRTTFRAVYWAVREALVGSGLDRIYVEKVVKFLLRYAPLNAINPLLKSRHQLTEVQLHYLEVIFLKSILDLDILRSLHLAPPENCDFEKWVCLFGPCSSSTQLRCQNYLTLQSIREKLGHVDNLPPNYFDRFKEVWASKGRKNKLSRRRSKNCGFLSPLILFPLRSLAPKCREKILQKHPVLRVIADELFVCCDHFGPSSSEAKSSLPLPLRSSTIFNYSLEYLNLMINEGLVSLRFGKEGRLSVPLLGAILKLCRTRGPFISPSPINLSAIGSLNCVKRISMEPMDELLEEVDAINRNALLPIDTNAVFRNMTTL